MGYLFIFLLIQVAVNYGLRYILSMFINLETIYGMLAFYMISSLIISFFGALLATPRGYKKDFYRQPGFHRTMIVYFVVFLVLDLIFVGFDYLW